MYMHTVLKVVRAGERTWDLLTSIYFLINRWATAALHMCTLWNLQELRLLGMYVCMYVCIIKYRLNVLNIGNLITLHNVWRNAECYVVNQFCCSTGNVSDSLDWLNRKPRKKCKKVQNSTNRSNIVSSMEISTAADVQLNICLCNFL
jgi:hypothetical protein